MNKDDLERQAWRIHKESVIVDGLQYVPILGGFDYIEKLIAVGIAAGNVTVPAVEDTTEEALGRMKAWYDLFENHADKVMMITRGRDIEEAKKKGKLGVIIGSQNAVMLGKDINLLTVYQKLGFRIIQLSYERQTLLGEGCGERTNGGLTNFGVEVVQEMNRLGLIVDVSHCKDQVTMDAIEVSKVPVIASHANPRGMVDHIRCKTDEQIRALAEKGGVIGLVPYRMVCITKKGVPPTLKDFLDIVDYTVRVAGIDHVGIGTDLTPYQTREQFEAWAKSHPRISLWGTPEAIKWEEKHFFNVGTEGHQDPAKWIEITKGLLERGYAEEDIKKIYGLNFLRVFKQVCGE